jgi:hypothetical protein
MESAIRDAVAQGVIDSCDPAQASLALFGLIEGLVTQARIMNDPEILQKHGAFAREGETRGARYRLRLTVSSSPNALRTKTVRLF